MTSDFGKDRERERVPRRQQLILRDASAVFDEDVRAVNDLVTRCFAPRSSMMISEPLRSSRCVRPCGSYRLQIEILDRAVLTSFVLRRQTRRTADVERAHRQLRAGFGLRSNDTDRLANFNGRPVARLRP